MFALADRVIAFEGTGGPENANLAGLPVSYFVQQLADFKSGARKMSGPERPSIQLMMASAKGMTDAEVLAAAEYFAALKPKRIIKVVESETIPKTGPSRLFYVKSPEGGTEPLGQRIVEMPDDVDQFDFVTHERRSRPMCRLEAWRREKHSRKPVDRERPLPAASATGGN